MSCPTVESPRIHRPAGFVALAVVQLTAGVLLAVAGMMAALGAPLALLMEGCSAMTSGGAATTPSTPTSSYLATIAVVDFGCAVLLFVAAPLLLKSQRTGLVMSILASLGIIGNGAFRILQGHYGYSISVLEIVIGSLCLMLLLSPPSLRHFGLLQGHR